MPSFTTHRDPWEPGGENVLSDLGQCEVQVRIADRAAGGGCTSSVSRVHGRWEAYVINISLQATADNVVLTICT